MDDVLTESQLAFRSDPLPRREQLKQSSVMILAICLALVSMTLPAGVGYARAATTADASKSQTKSQRVDHAALRASGPRHRHRNYTASRLEPSDMADALEVLHDFNPDLAKKLGDWLKEHPQNASKQLSRRVPWIVRLVHLRRNDPAGYQLAVADLRDYARTKTLAARLRKAQNAHEKDQARIDTLTIKLKKLLADHFDLRQKIRARDIQKLQDRLTQFRKQMAKRLASRDRILQARFNQLTRSKKSAGKSHKGHKDAKQSRRSKSKSRSQSKSE